MKKLVKDLYRSVLQESEKSKLIEELGDLDLRKIVLILKDIQFTNELMYTNQYLFLQNKNLSFKQQLTNMTKHYFVQEMKRAINLMDPTKNTSLNEIFSKAVNNIIINIFKRQNISKELFENMSEDILSNAYKYIWSEAKQIFADRYSTYKSWYEIRKTGRQI